jgi:hypothetical protein
MRCTSEVTELLWSPDLPLSSLSLSLPLSSPRLTVFEEMEKKKHHNTALSHFSAQASHASELANLTSEPTSEQSWTQRAKSSVPLAFALYLWNTLTSWVWTFVTSPASILLDPLSTLTALVVYPVVWIGLGIATFVFWIASLSGGGKLIESFSEKFANGYSMVNWVSSPSLFLSLSLL